jgi:DNA-3-methyladenine glycosylase II
MASGTLQVEARGPFSLARSVAFAGGFAPAGAPQANGDVLRLAFVDDGGEAAAIAARQSGSKVSVDYVSALDPSRVAGHAALRPVLFGSPFEAAVWAVLSQRTSMRQAAAVRARLVEQLGTALEIDGAELRAFPSPERLARVESLPTGVPAVKAERLRGLARAAAAGELDADALRAMEPEAALEGLAQLPGIGPFSAQLILLRGAGHPDVLPLNAPRLASSVREAYGLDGDPSPAQLEALAEGWRPFRSWVVFLLRQ